MVIALIITALLVTRKRDGEDEELFDDETDSSDMDNEGIDEPTEPNVDQRENANRPTENEPDVRQDEDISSDPDDDDIEKF